ncbi:NAD(P)H-dependent oxidoreductase [Mogibacterium sp.]|uniref:NAD(P)H-dependent oxidoreductase n=1 Tax=Mogibacterium sp. TaxID=2049035 RepID=UPI0025846361|nr:NAD(P)H-dependent oxidoreductase [Mogibacterium sp.]MCI7123906.1 flavodoxin family protein [Mogibacterium sp.]
MNVLLINGSPKGKNSNSLKLAYSFIEGLKSEYANNGKEISIEELHVASMNIDACKGCFTCWKKTPGICCIKDDMQTVIGKQLKADIILWSFPLYYFNVPGILKNLIDRQLPMSLPFMSSREDGYGSGSHDSRYNMEGKRHVLISTCGFYSTEGNYDSVLRMFDHFLGKGNYETVFCGQGELFRVKELSARTEEYLDAVKVAGAEYAETGMISAKTDAVLRTLLYPRDVFEKMADASWGINRTTGEKEPEDLVFTRQMAALYNKNAYDGKERVLEMHFTDLNHTYQIRLGKEGSEVVADGSLTSTTRIDTPFAVWLAISRGEIGGAEALGKQMYTVAGDFSLMIDWDKFFGSRAAVDKAETTGSDTTEQKKPTMAAMLIPWIAFWIAVSINPAPGAVIALTVAAAIPLLMRNHKLVIWDRLSIFAVAILSAAANITGNGDIPTNAGYLIFGLFWLISCLTKEPLCAAYVKYNYGGESARQNPLFMRTNYILAAAWGLLYVLTAAWTFLFRSAGIANTIIIVNNLIPLLMGLFTLWFQKWYPARMARGKTNRK